MLTVEWFFETRKQSMTSPGWNMGYNYRFKMWVEAFGRAKSYGFVQTSRPAVIRRRNSNSFPTLILESIQ